MSRRHDRPEGPHPYGKMRRYVRARLHRKLFAWFGLSILATMLVASGVLALVGREDDGGWRGDFHRVAAFTANRVADAWDDPARRESFARSLATELRFGVRLRDASGAVLVAEGRDCYGPSTAAVVRDGVPVGSLALCWPHHGRPWMPVVFLVTACLMLWGAAGLIARRLVRPIAEVARVAKQIGAGRLSARAALGCREADEVGELATSVNEMATRIEKQLADQRELLAAVSHELRTPLSRIRLLVELSRDGGLDGGRRLDEIDAEVMEIDALVGELLASSRMDFAALAASRITASEIARRSLERAGVTAELLVVERDTTFDADPTLVSRALANLIDNARRHGGGLSRLRVGRRGEVVTFEAEDAGPGFPAGGEQHLFEPFGPTADGKARGPNSLGLGLALVRRIAVAHGGQAYARNRDGGGAVVGIELPVERPVEASAADSERGGMGEPVPA